MFFVKIPSFFFHLWLPKAHVEAPVSGSMILAGVLLKLGVYGLIVYLPFIFYQIDCFYDFFFLWGIWGAFLSSFICFRQVDLKKMIAYISIIHIGICISGLFSFLFYSSLGVFFIILAHGLTSSAIFYSLNCFYERVFSRRIFFIKGNLIFFTRLFFWFVVLISSNIALPPSFNFFSELILIFSILHFNFFDFILLFALVFLSSLVSFHIFVSIYHGHIIRVSSFNIMNLKEMIVHLRHIFPIFFIFILF
jgi:NADH-ubiquinone oxidoreductase chain 4